MANAHTEPSARLATIGSGVLFGDLIDSRKNCLPGVFLCLNFLNQQLLFVATQISTLA
jgi:hypothetical protein